MAGYIYFTVYSARGSLSWNGINGEISTISGAPKGGPIMVKRVLGALTTLALAAWITMAVGPMAFASSTQQHGQSSTTTQSVQSGSLTQPQPYSNADLNGT